MQKLFLTYFLCVVVYHNYLFSEVSCEVFVENAFTPLGDRVGYLDGLTRTCF